MQLQKSPNQTTIVFSAFLSRIETLETLDLFLLSSENQLKYQKFIVVVQIYMILFGMETCPSKLLAWT
jgi:hypothetical protein